MGPHWSSDKVQIPHAGLYNSAQLTSTYLYTYIFIICLYTLFSALSTHQYSPFELHLTINGSSTATCSLEPLGHCTCCFLYVEYSFPLLISQSQGGGAQETINHNLRNAAEVLSWASIIVKRRKEINLDSLERGKGRKDHPILLYLFLFCCQPPSLLLHFDFLHFLGWLTTKWNPLERWLQGAAWEGALNSWHTNAWGHHYKMKMFPHSSRRRLHHSSFLISHYILYPWFWIHSS